jgi:hypothetical protein
MTEIVDLKILKPDELVIRIADKDINISNIPFEIALDIIEKMDELGEEENLSKRKLLSIFKDIVINVLHETDNSIDEKWVRKNVNAFQMMRLIDRIVNPILDGLGIGAKSGTGKVTKKK